MLLNHLDRGESLPLPPSLLSHFSLLLLLLLMVRLLTPHPSVRAPFPSPPPNTRARAQRTRAVRTHIASAVIQVAQDAEEGWPIELIDENDDIIEVYMQPGQMLLYEGSRVPHGRPRRFEGDSFANIFAHYKPKDWTYDAELSKELDEKAYQVQQQGQTQ